MKQELYPLAVNWFVRVMRGETYEQIGRSAGVNSGSEAVRVRVAEIYRKLNHPRLAIENEVLPPASSHNEFMPKAIRTNHEYYSARLAKFCEEAGIDIKNKELPDSVGLGAEKPEWSEEKDALLGTMSDRALAIKLNTTVYNVRKRRLALGINSLYSEKHNILPYRS